MSPRRGGGGDARGGAGLAEALGKRLSEHDVPARISGRNLRKLLDLSREAFDALVATGALGQPVTYGDHPTAYRYFRVDAVLEWLRRREQAAVYRENAARARAQAVLRG